MMFGLSWLARSLREACVVSAGLLASVGFIVLASASIHYDETIAPKVARLTGGVPAADHARRLSL